MLTCTECLDTVRVYVCVRASMGMGVCATICWVNVADACTSLLLFYACLVIFAVTLVETPDFYGPKSKQQQQQQQHDMMAQEEMHSKVASSSKMSWKLMQDTVSSSDQQQMMQLWFRLMLANFGQISVWFLSAFAAVLLAVCADMLALLLLLFDFHWREGKAGCIHRLLVFASRVQPMQTTNFGAMQYIEKAYAMHVFYNMTIL